jgi:PilZ domain-containing protein
MDERDGDEGENKRRDKRSLVLLAAKLRTPGETLDVRLRNLSQKGALVECTKIPPVGSEVVFERGQTSVPARVAWAAKGRIGIEFLVPIEESEVLVHVGRPQARRETPPPVVRRSGLHQTQLSAGEKKFGAAWVKPPGRVGE